MMDGGSSYSTTYHHNTTNDLFPISEKLKNKFFSLHVSNKRTPTDLEKSHITESVIIITKLFHYK